MKEEINFYWSSFFCLDKKTFEVTYFDPLYL